MDKDIWLKYVGAYKNLSENDEEEMEEELPIIPLVGKTKLSGTRVIDADYILNLIGSKLENKEGSKVIDSENLRLIYEEIQELSNMGEDDQAKLLRDFVENELVPGKISSDVDFDKAFSNWKENKIKKEVTNFAENWDLDADILYESFKKYSVTEKDTIPYVEDIYNSMDYKKAKKRNRKTNLNILLK